MNFPGSAFIVMIKRDDQYIRPGGSTVLYPNDVLMVLADNESDFELVQQRLANST